jgi:hypothetical protein
MMFVRRSHLAATHAHHRLAVDGAEECGQAKFFFVAAALRAARPRVFDQKRPNRFGERARDEGLLLSLRTSAEVMSSRIRR